MCEKSLARANSFPYLAESMKFVEHRFGCRSSSASRAPKANDCGSLLTSLDACRYEPPYVVVSATSAYQFRRSTSERVLHYTCCLTVIEVTLPRHQRLSCFKILSPPERDRFLDTIISLETPCNHGSACDFSEV
jgi:hypothetical protein